MRKLLILLLVIALSQTWIKFAAADENTFALPSDAQLKGASEAKLASVAFQPPTGEQFDVRLKQISESFKPIDYEPALKAKEIGAGIKPSFKFVRDQIHFESYPGVLRGAKGAYIAKAANASDRSLLLAGLLQTKGVECRFAIGHLPDAECQKLFDQMFSAADKPAKLEDSGQSGEFAKAVRARALRDYAAIRAALGDHLPATTTPDRAALIKEIASHVWVQAKSGDQWIDLDASFADAQPGKSYCHADQVVSALPPEMFQQVTIRVIVETLDGASLKKETALELTRPVRELAEKQIFLLHVPPAGLAGVGNAIGGMKDAWAPSLWIDGDIVVGKPVSFDDSAKPAAGGALGGVLDAIGDNTTSAGPTIVSETLEFELTAPGTSPQVVRRTLFDRGGPVWRRSAPDVKTLRPLERDENGPVAAQALHDIWFSTGRHNMSDYASAMGMLVDSLRTQKRGAPQEDDFNRQVWPIALQNLATVMWADQTFLPALNDDPSARFYCDSPRILLFSISVHKNPSAADDKMIDFQIDLRRDFIRGVAKDDSVRAAVVQRKLWYGALEGALEHETVAMQASAMSDKGASVSSTSALLGKNGAVVLTSANAPKSWRELSSNELTAARLAAALEGPNVLVIPNDAIASADGGWWEISPTGDLRAVSVDGLNGGRINISGGYVRQSPGMYGGSSGPGTTYHVNPDGSSYYYKPKQKGGNEYGTLLTTISIPGGGVIRVTVTRVVVACALAAAACFAWEIFK